MLTAEATTTLLLQLRGGGDGARSALRDGLYGELRALAGSMLRGQGQTLQPTALVHEAWLKLGSDPHLQVADKAHFLAVAATAMRQVLVDNARARSALKRGGGARPLSLEDLDATSGDSAPEEVIAVDECLRQLEALDPRQAQVVEMRVFAGMTVAEVADALGVSTRTVELDWRMARAWLASKLSHADR
ncbi:MAG: ECF-type sigma factor [Phycisphaerales bacterium]